AELGGEIDVAAELEHAVVVALEHGFGLLRRQLEPLEILRLVRLERLAVLILHQGHAEHVDAVALARAFGVEHEGAGNIVVFLLLAGHAGFSLGNGGEWPPDISIPFDIYALAGLCNVRPGAVKLQSVARERRPTRRLERL